MKKTTSTFHTDTFKKLMEDKGFQAKINYEGTSFIPKQDNKEKKKEEKRKKFLTYSKKQIIEIGNKKQIVLSNDKELFQLKVIDWETDDINTINY
tara:strand:- start:94 stop:378 length:285 start_codon:yes stop_codon:yes gene_type:complete